MEQTKIYTAITHDPTGGHSVHYVQLPLGMGAARTYFHGLVEEFLSTGIPGNTKLVAIIPGRHVVGLGTHDNNKSYYPDGATF